MNETTAVVLSAAILGFPLLGALLNALVGQRYGRRFANWCGPLAVFFAFVAACVIVGQVFSSSTPAHSTTVQLWDWLDLGRGNLRLSVDTTLDPLSAVMCMVITGVGFLIHVFSVGYMEHDESPHRFFSYMNFFVLAMLLLVLAANLVILIVGWAMVALASYLLIAYWYDRPSAVLAGRKAFVTQVVGDVGLVIAAFMIVTNLHDSGGRSVFSLSLPTIFADAHSSFSSGGALVTGICVLLAVGAFAKSAQFPLHTWLPDAMEGPTPVSALLHAATMVTAGVYLIARFHVLFDMAPYAQGMVAAVGMGTAVMAGVIALSQIDIKRVIAYSTMSQIGLMIFADGVGAYSAGIYHLVTHAIFKALLFLAAGNVIHAMHDEQDMRLFGGLSGRMRRTELSFLAGCFALAGIPIFAGFWSKEDLLGFGAVHGPLPPILFVVGVGVNILTGLYIFRAWAMTFRGEPQTARVFQAHEAPAVMLYPVMALGVMAAVIGVVLQWPFQVGGFAVRLVAEFLDPVFRQGTGQVTAEPGTLVGAVTITVGTLGSLLGVGAALRLWVQRRPDAQVVASRLPRLLTQLSLHKFYVDDLYDALLVFPARAVARGLRRVVEPRVMDGWVRWIALRFSELSLDFRMLQTGLIRDYALGMAAAVFVGVIVIVRVLAQ